jgi:hypothetical protein
LGGAWLRFEQRGVRQAKSVAIADAELPPVQERGAAGALRMMEDAFEGSPLIFTRDSTG